MQTVEMSVLERWEAVEALQELYPTFDLFLAEGIEELLGFTCTDIQLDIGDFLENGPQLRMIQAQRSQAKTTVTSFYAVWRYIHNPAEIVLIFSAGGDMANEVATGIIQILGDWEELGCLRPGPDDRQATKSFDIHKDLKGYNKSPSLACMGITANMQGRRASLLIADDVESGKNSLTEVQRELLLMKTRDFTSICTKGDIVYLGTPQSNDSVYRTLPGRGFQLRIWPGRYPTVKEEKNYGEHLAPMIKEAMEANPSLRTGGGPLGDRGQACDPVLLPDYLLNTKEMDQGPAYFQLQHMLDTALMDAERFPLRERHLIFASLDKRKAHATYSWSPDNTTVVKEFPGTQEYDFHYASSKSSEMFDYTGSVLYIDFAGGGQSQKMKGLDEMAGVVTKFMHGTIFVMDMDAFVPDPQKGEEEYKRMAILAYDNEVQEVVIERNQGGEMMVSTLKNVINRHYLDMSLSQPEEHARKFPEGKGARGPNVTSDFATGQKELRIIDTLEPLIRRHAVVMSTHLIEKDQVLCRQYPVARAKTYSLFHQLKKITRDKASLAHEDRLDALAGACGFWAERVVQDASVMAVKRATQENDDFMAAWGADIKGNAQGITQRRNNRSSGANIGGGIFNRRF